MKTKIFSFCALLVSFVFFSNQTNAAASVTLTTPSLAAGTVFQGTNTNVIYIVSMAVAVESVTVNKIDFMFSGTQDADDFSTVSVYFNPTAPTISGASFRGSTSANFAAGHSYSVNISNTLSAGTTGYFLITLNASSNASDNKTVRLTGSATPVVFGYTVAPVLTNNQNNNAGLQTIQSADVTLSTSAVPSATIFQGTNTNVVYITKVEVATASVTINNIQFTLSGTQDADDLGTVSVYFNPTAPTISGASFRGSTPGNFAAPHAYSINISNTLAAGTIGYFLITVNVNSGASDNKTVRITGATTPVTFGYTTSPNVVSSQNNGGTLQIQASDVTLSTSPVAADTIYQGTNTNVVYITRVDVVTASVTINNIQFTLSGTHNADDLGTVSVYFNPTSPSISGASFRGSTPANFAAPHAYSINIFNTLAAGTTGYFLITVNVNSGASDNKTVRVTGASTPVTFGYTTSPNVTNSQNNGAGLQSIQAADILLSTSPVAADTIFQGTNTNVVYITKVDVATASVAINNIEFTLSGTHDNDDLGTVSVYFNATSPSITGASFRGSTAANFAAPHAYSINISNTLAAGTTGYFLVTVNVNSGATDNKTVRITGASTPVIFGYTTSPNVTNSQNNTGGLQSIQAADITLSTSAVAANTIFQGSNTNVVYITRVDIATASATINNIKFTLSGTHDNDDLGTVSVYFNPTAPSITGASFRGSTAANFAAPHDYSINISNTLAAGTTGYFLITVNVNSSATDNKTVRITGNTTPITFGYTTSPNITNSQSNGGGLQTIQASDITLSTSPTAAGNIVRGTNANVIYIAKVDVATANISINNIQFTLSGTHDNDDLSTVSVYFNATAPSITGASFRGSTAANFAAPHAYSINISNTLTASTTGYFLITVNVNSGASTGKTVQINGSTNPVVFGYTTSPNVTNSQSNSAGIKTISASFAAEKNEIFSERMNLSVYPNPVNSRLNYFIVSESNQKIKVQLVDMAGKVYINKSESLLTGRNDFSYYSNGLVNGNYQLIIINEKKASYLNQQIKIQH